MQVFNTSIAGTFATDGSTTPQAQKIGHDSKYNSRCVEAYEFQSSNPLRGAK